MGGVVVLFAADSPACRVRLRARGIGQDERRVANTRVQSPSFRRTPPVEANQMCAPPCGARAPRPHPPQPHAQRPREGARWLGRGGGRVSPGLHALSRLSKWRISRSYITFIDTIINISYTLISLSSLKISAADISTFHTHITLWLARASHHIGRKSPPYAWHERDRERARARDAVNDSTRGLDGTSRATNRGRPGHGAPGARQGIARSIVLRAHGAARPHCIGTAVATGM